MADRVHKVNYCYATVPARAGSGAKLLGALKKAGINMLAFSGFPSGAGKAQLDFVVANVAAVRKAAAKHGWKLSAAKKAFLIEGADRAGAVHAHIKKLADRNISITAADAVTTGNRYGMILFVKPRDYVKAAKALGAR
jgi:hypothetical protein